jgi:ABC-type nitrate/sulfonate/bicarbonate transport system permease component
MFNPYRKLSSSEKSYLGMTSIIFVLVLWTLLAAFGGISENKLPSPLKVVEAFQYLIWNDGHSLLLTATMWSFGRVLTAGIAVVLVGIPLGVLMGSSPKINAMISPMIDPFRSAPVVALLPIMVMWLGIGEEMKISFLFLGAVVYLVPMVRDAILAVPYAYWESIKDLGATDIECITKGIFQIASPRIADAVIVSFSIMWTYITVAEYVNAGEGIGQLIQNARRFSAMDQVFVGIFTITFLALITYQGMTWLKRKVYHWEQAA